MLRQRVSINTPFSRRWTSTCTSERSRWRAPRRVSRSYFIAPGAKEPRDTIGSRLESSPVKRDPVARALRTSGNRNLPGLFRGAITRKKTPSAFSISRFPLSASIDRSSGCSHRILARTFYFSSTCREKIIGAANEIIAALERENSKTARGRAGIEICGNEKSRSV